MSTLRKKQLPFRWSAINIGFTAGATSSAVLSSFLSNPEARSITYSVTGSLPTGVTHSSGTLTYNGVGAAASASIVFNATDGTYTANSVASTVQILDPPPPPNTEPVWIGSTPSSLGSFINGTGGTVQLNVYAFDAEGDTMQYFRTGGTGDTAPGTVTVNQTSGVLTIPASLPAGTYSIVVDVIDV